MSTKEIDEKEKEKKEIREKREKEDKLKKIIEDNHLKYIRLIGEGSYGAVVEVEKNKRKLAVKIILYDGEKKRLKTEDVKDFRGKNIVKIVQEIQPQQNPNNHPYDEKYYYCYVMECSFIGSLYDFDKFIYDNLIFKVPFLERFGDNLTRFFVQQMVTALKTLYLGNLVHFDIKPDNMLIRKGLDLKLIDFSFLKQFTSGKKGNIPGGTPGYITPEYYQNMEFDFETLQKQDYFALGMTIFYIKYGIGSLDNFSIKKEYNNDLKSTIITESIIKAMNTIQTQKFQDKDFDKFLCNLIQFKPEDRLNFEQIVRNKWLNKNTQEIEKIIDINECDEDNMVLELQKSDFLIKNRKYYRKNFDERYNNENDNKKYKQIKKGKFKFGKRN